MPRPEAPHALWGEDRDDYPEGSLAPSTLTEREALRLADSVTPLSEFRCLYMYDIRYEDRTRVWSYGQWNQMRKPRPTRGHT